MSAEAPQCVRVRDLIVRAVRFRDERDRRPKTYQGPVAGLIGRHRARSRKRGTPAFSMAVYEDGAFRGNRGVREVTAVVLDFDHLDSGVAEDVQRRLEGRAHLAYTSYSHLSKGPDDACFRVVLFCTRSMSLEEYASVWSKPSAKPWGWPSRRLILGGHGNDTAQLPRLRATQRQPSGLPCRQQG